MINTEDQWTHFCTTLKKQGLLSDPDIMEDIWVELVTQGKIFQAEGRPKINLTFEKEDRISNCRHRCQ